MADSKGHDDPVQDKTLNLSTRKNFRDYATQRDTHLKTIESTLGFPLALGCDYVALSKVSADRGYENRAGEIVWGSLLEHLANLLKSFCEDDMNKEALTSALKGKKKLIIRNNDKEELPSYQNIRVRDGELVLEFKSDNWWTNVDSIDNSDGKKMLEATL